MHSDKILGEEHFKVLKFIQETMNPSAVIAGGAVRDLLFNRPFKDIDIFMQTKKSIPISRSAKYIEYELPNKLGFGPNDFYDPNLEPEEANEPQLRSGPSRYGESRPIRTLWYRGDKYELINIESPVQEFIMTQFDVNLNKVWHNGEKSVRTQLFASDFANKTLTVDPTHWNSENFERVTMKRVPILQKKFPDFKVVILKLAENKTKPSKSGAEKSIAPGVRWLGGGRSLYIDLNTNREITPSPSAVNGWRFVTASES